MSEQAQLTKRELEFRDRAIHLQEQLDLAVMERDSAIEECVKCVPTTWLDPLLTGPNAIGDLPERETEALLRGIQDRIRALKRGDQ